MTQVGPRDLDLRKLTEITDEERISSLRFDTEQFSIADRMQT